MPREKTTIEITADSWSGLNQLKQPGDSFEDVIRRLLELEGANVEPPQDDDAYVSGDVVLVWNDRREEGNVLRPALKIRDKRASENGDYEVVNLSNIKFGSDSTEPRARGYIRGNSKYSINDDKMVELTEAGSLSESQ